MLKRKTEAESRATPLRQGPYISLSKPFATGSTIQKLVDDGVFHPGMHAVVPYEGLRAHQDQAVRSISAGRNTLVATGTGSGKTESFLYPIISRCLQLEEGSGTIRKNYSQYTRSSTMKSKER